MVVLRGAAGSRDFDLRAEAVPIALRANKADEQPVVRLWRTVYEDLGRDIEGGDDGVDLPVVIQVAERYSTVALRHLKGRPRVPAYVREMAVAKIAQNEVRQFRRKVVGLLGVVENSRAGGE